jgi:Xaa-Pro aminopeptidase
MTDKAVYNAVLRVKNEATKMLVPGTLWKQYHIEVGKLMTSELLGLGLLDKADVQNESPESLHTKIFHARNIAPHGLDTHDYGILTEPASQYGFHRRTRNLYSC